MATPPVPSRLAVGLIFIEYAGMAGGAIFAAARGWLDARCAAVRDAIQRTPEAADALLLLVDDANA